MTKRILFSAAFLITTAVMSGVHYIGHRNSAATRPKLTQITDGVFITSQLQPDSVTYLKRRGIKTVVDIRPDGEDAGQPPSTDIERAAKAGDVSFYYIPVPHEIIPDAAVDALSAAMAASRLPTVLYCRTGRRAVRLFALAEATRADGPAADSIQLMVKKAGFSADDLQDAIANRIDSRGK
jgi:uncharacterized protein (TIGR01244 family)